MPPGVVPVLLRVPPPFGRRDRLQAENVNRREFSRVVDAVLAELPEWVTERIDNLVVVVEDRPTHDQDPEGQGLLGLYDGVSLADRGVDYFGYAPDQISIFYEPHIELGLSDEELNDEIRVTVLHEVAHHLGIDDQRLHELGWD
ncbi:MAG: metallopeptidase family protein [Acidimicrobiia bacterium]